MIKGTHNSGTSGRLVWWQRPFAVLLHLTSRCQEKSIAQQLYDGVKLFNLQVTFYKGEWHFGHGLCIYNEKLHDALNAMKDAATTSQPIYFQLYLDKNFFCGQNRGKFKELVDNVKATICSDSLIMLSAWIEGSEEYLHKANVAIDKREHYWTMAWGRAYGKNLIDYLPLPRLHAKKFNKQYREECSGKYLILDFYNI